MFKRVLIFILVVLPLSSMAQDTFPSPFGLTWGASAEDLQSIGFSKLQSVDGFVRMTSVSAPKAWSKAERYLALLYDDRLVKVAVASVSFTDDLSGSDGKELYESVVTTLTAKYGAPSDVTELVGRKLYDGYDEFYQCLDYAGCGYYGTMFEIDGGIIGVRIVGESRGRGYVAVQYESPGFSEAKAAIEASNGKSDASAF